MTEGLVSSPIPLITQDRTFRPTDLTRLNFLIHARLLLGLESIGGYAESLGPTYLA